MRSLSVEAITLETLGHDVSVIDILKIDIEGLEFEILQGSLSMLAKIRRIIVERHSRMLRDKVVGLLTANGFSLVFEEDPQCTRYYGDLYFVNSSRLP